MSRKITYQKRSWAKNQETESIEEMLDYFIEQDDEQGVGELEAMRYQTKRLKQIVGCLLEELSDDKVVKILKVHD